VVIPEEDLICRKHLSYVCRARTSAIPKQVQEEPVEAQLIDLSVWKVQSYLKSRLYVCSAA